MYPNPFTYHRPETIDDAAALLTKYGDDAAPYAGGTELLLAMKMGFAQYEHLIDLKCLAALRNIARDDDILLIGALASHAEIAANPMVNDLLPALSNLCSTIANPRVRSSGTIGGNLCFAEPRADPPTLLAGLDASLILLSSTGERRVAAAAFITGVFETVRAPDELLLRIEIPLTPCAVRYERIVFGHRTVAGAIAALGRHGSLERIWVGGVAACPSPLPVTQSLLESDQNATDALVHSAVMQDIATLDIADDEEASADYRRHLAATVALRAIAKCREDLCQ